MISLTIDDSDVLRSVDALSDRHLLYDPMEASLSLLHDYMAQYPAPPAGSSYRRSGNYGRLWSTSIRTQGADIRGELGNAVRGRNGRAYGPFVGADPAGPKPNQARIHQGRWRTDRGAIEENERRIREYFDKALTRAAKR